MKQEINKTIITPSALIRAVQERFTAERALQGSVWIIAGYAFLAGLTGVFFNLTLWTGSVGLLVSETLCALVGVVGWCCYVWLIKPISSTHIAALLDEIACSPRKELSLAYELECQSATEQNLLLRAAQNQLTTKIQHYPHRIPVAFKFSVAVAGIALIFGVFSVGFSPESLGSVTLRALKPQATFAHTIFPGTRALAKGASQDLVCTVVSSSSPLCQLLLQSATFPARRITLVADSALVFRYHIPEVTTSLTYSFLLDGARVNHDSLMVIEPPRICSLRVVIQPPLYLKLSNDTIAQVGGFAEVYPLSQISFDLYSSWVLDSAHLGVAQQDVPLSCTANRASGGFPLQPGDSGAVTALFTDSLGQKSKVLTLLNLRSRVDARPYVRIVQPGKNSVLSVEQQETLVVEATDDIGIKSLEVKWYRGENRDTGILTCEVPRTPQSVVHTLAWDIRRLSLYPGDSVFYYALVRDNNPFQKGAVSSDTFWFCMPSLEEMVKASMAGEERAVDALSNAQERAGKLQKILAKELKNSRQKKEFGWQEQDAATHIAEERKEVIDSIAAASEALSETVKNLREKGEFTSDLAKKMDEVARELEELRKEYGDSLFGLPENKEPTIDDMRNALVQAKNALPNLKERLEKTLEFLKALKKDRALLNLATKALELARSQTALISQPDSPTQERLLTDEKKLAEDASAQECSVDDVRSAMDAVTLSNASGVGAQKSAMQKNAAALGNLAEALKSKMSRNQDEDNAKMREGLLACADALLFTGAWNSEATPDPRVDTGDHVAAVREYQNILEATRGCRMLLDSIPQLLPSLHRAIASYLDRALSIEEQTVQMVAKGWGKAGILALGAALRTTAAVILAIVNQLDDMQQQSSQSGMSGMMQGLRKASGQQSMVNALTGQLLRQMMQQGQSGAGEDGSSDDGSENGTQGKKTGGRAQSEAQAAQQRIADELQRLRETFGGSVDKSVREQVEQLEQEAQELADQLGRLPEIVTERQDRFLVRMLEASLSMHKQNEGGDEDRKSTRATTMFTPGSAGDPGLRNRGSDAYARFRQQLLGKELPDYLRSAAREYADSMSGYFLK